MAATDEEKLRALLPHWMEHNDEHAAEFRAWADRARAAGHDNVAGQIEAAAQELVAVNGSLRAALEALGGVA
jgi:hypothetical protein